MSHAPLGTPILKQLTPFHSLEPSHQKYVSVARFHGTQKLKLMRPTRLPANSRRYTPGDPVNLIDWRAYARNEQLVLREQNDEASCKVQIFLDLKASMQWPEGDTLRSLDTCSKSEIALRMGLNLAYQFFRWGDQVKVWVVLEGKALPLRMRSQSDVAIAFEKISQQNFQVKEADLGPARNLATFRESRNDLVFWLSDGFQGIPDWINPKGLVCWLQILSSLELDPSWLDPATCYFEKNAKSEEYLGAALLQNEGLHQAIQSWLLKIGDEWLKQFTHHLIFTEKTAIHQYIFALEQPWLRAVRGRV